MTEFIDIFAKIIFYILLVFFILQAIFFAYHWFKYGESKNISLIAFAIYLIGGAILFLSLSLSLQSL